MGKMSPGELRRAIVVLGARSDQTRQSLVDHALTLNAIGVSWVEDIRAILRSDPSVWTDKDRMVVNTFALYGAQTLAASFAEWEVSEAGGDDPEPGEQKISDFDID
jgi:hypothetical protein